MALTLTVGTNTYISRTDATAYFEGRLYSTAWTAAADSEKDQALVMATKAIDRLALRGIKKDTSQALQFPRCYPADPRTSNLTRIFNGGQVYTDGYYRCEEETPQAVLDAVCEEALALLGYDPTNRARRDADGLKSVKVGDVSEEYRPAKLGILLSPEARDLMRPYIAGVVTIV